MRAARCEDRGGIDAIVVRDVDPPLAGPDEILVDVIAAAVNFPDVLIVQNRYQVSAEPPFTPGSEFAGVVRGVGSDVTGVEPGDHVMGSTFVGAFAEQVAVPASAVTVVPRSVDLRLAAGYRVAYGTAYHALVSVARVRQGEWVVVLGAAGGVGLAAVDLARLIGARVVAAASTDDKIDLCRSRGAHAVVNYAREELKTRLKQLTGGGAHVVVDPVGGPYSELALRATRWGGRFVCVGFASGEIPRIPLNLLLLKGVWMTGFEKRTFPMHAPDDEARSRRELVEWLANGRVHPYVSCVFGLDEVRDALTVLAERRALGKVIIDVQRGDSELRVSDARRGS